MLDAGSCRYNAYSYRRLLLTSTPASTDLHQSSTHFPAGPLHLQRLGRYLSATKDTLPTFPLETSRDLHDSPIESS
jgi:hypothetical protein